MRRARFALAVAALAALAATGRAQLEVTVPPGSKEPVIRGQLDPVAGTHQPGGYGYAALTLRNVDTEAREVAAAVRCVGYGWRSLDFSCQRRVRLEPGEEARIVLPLPTGAGHNAHFTLDVSGISDAWIQNTPGAANTQGLTVMFLGDDTVRGAEWQQLFEEISERHAPAPGGRTKRPSHLGAWHNRRTNGLPDRWQWLTGFDVIVVDGRARDLDGPAQRLLREYAEGGGALLVLAPDTMPAGPLKDALARDRSPLGRWLTLDQPEPGGDADRRLDRWLRPMVTSAFDNGPPAVAGPVPAAMHEQLSIRGLGEVPVRLFFVFILVFAVVVGPISHFVAYRKRKPLLMLFTVPVLGIGCTVFFLALGLFSEGFGIQGAIRSFTVLDQREHRAVSVSGRTLYAGLSPAALEPSAGTYLYSPRSWSSRRVSANPFDLDLDGGGRIGGSLLPSRNPTAFVAVRQGPCRDRLRFRRREGGDLEILAGPNLQPTLVLLRDRDERLYRNEDDGRMVPVPEGTLRGIRDQLEKTLSLEATGPELSHLGMVAATPSRETSILPQGLILEPGTYLALVEDIDTVDDFGLTVDYLDAVHVVKGLLAEEDIVE